MRNYDLAAPVYMRFPLRAYADDHGDLCGDDANDERLFVGLWNDWRKYRRVDAPRVLALDFAGIARVQNSTAKDCLAAFASMIVDASRPYYMLCVNARHSIRDPLEAGFDASRIVVATEFVDGSGTTEYALVGSPENRRRFMPWWEQFIEAARDNARSEPEHDIWRQGREIERVQRYPKMLLEQMYEHGTVIKDPEGRPYYRPISAITSGDQAQLRDGKPSKDR